jgi:transcriptional regulator with XRE-family HTH domain
MKELINDLIERSGLTNEQFAEAVGISASNLSKQKNVRRIDHEKLIKWAKSLGIGYFEAWVKGDHIMIKC